MTKEDLAAKLDRLDPGASLTVPEEVLAPMFGVITLSHESQSALRDIINFALEHRCTFTLQEHEGTAPLFLKDDIF